MGNTVIRFLLDVSRISTANQNSQDTSPAIVQGIETSTGNLNIRWLKNISVVIRKMFWGRVDPKEYNHPTIGSHNIST